MDLQNNNTITTERIREIQGMLAWVRNVNPNRYKKILAAGAQVLSEIIGIEKQSSKDEKKYFTYDGDDEKMKLFIKALQKSSRIPFDILVKLLNFQSEEELIKWLWSIELEGFLIDLEQKVVLIDKNIKEIIDNIDNLFDAFTSWGKKGKEK
ncbi:MAG: hypothetical protein ACTSRR_13515 [Candidatus Heimdallarchaeaceae archaeon]